MTRRNSVGKSKEDGVSEGVEAYEALFRGSGHTEKNEECPPTAEGHNATAEPSVIKSMYPSTLQVKVAPVSNKKEAHVTEVKEIWSKGTATEQDEMATADLLEILTRDEIKLAFKGKKKNLDPSITK
ncbi:hypothetical protein QYM36_010951 [Artemia franciscana]|uniref:Uncharacterized protein n=1 Tax=Artemia franciscana TaxID=6661 RepID=A0AA88HWB8_ARTSF|nr:hypothetical protein QYM36_010951 [Artemia franciscana]